SRSYVDERSATTFVPAAYLRREVHAPIAAGVQEAPVMRPSDCVQGGANAGCIGLGKVPQIRTRQDHNLGGIFKANCDTGAVRRERCCVGSMTFQSESGDRSRILVGRIEPDKAIK